MSSQKSSSVVFRRFKVFSSKRVALSAKGTVEPSSEQQKKYWLVESASQGALTIQALDAKTWMPVGSTHPITVRELQKRYIPENGLYEQKVQPNLEKFSGNLSLLEAPEAEGVVSAADEAACITHFEEGIGSLNRGEQDKALAIFSELLHSELPFEEKHKHLFNTFAIQLRKNKLSSQAIAYYTRALELAWGEDENLHINLARVLFDEKQYGGCVQHLFDALRISPENSAARNFLSWLNTHDLIPKQNALEARALLGQRRPEDLLGEDGSDADAGKGRKEQEARATLDDGTPR